MSAWFKNREYIASVELIDYKINSAEKVAISAWWASQKTGYKANIFEVQPEGKKYLLNDKMRGHSEIRFESGDGTTVRLHFVDLARMQETLEELRDKLEVTES